ncbi:MAG: hypothetical protein COA78_16785 [Blastopirellula sp.]|nr:MAG: hypothetical protein COA78_16785 [Blastopirellula sp.]
MLSVIPIQLADFFCELASEVGWMKLLFSSTFKPFSIGIDHHITGMLQSIILCDGGSIQGG